MFFTFEVQVELSRPLHEGVSCEPGIFQPRFGDCNHLVLRGTILPEFLWFWRMRSTMVLYGSFQQSGRCAASKRDRSLHCK